MKPSPVLISITFLITLTTSLSQPLNDDVLGLIVFKSGLKDPHNSLLSWSQDDPSPCAWNFIKCDPANNRVSKIALHGLRLSGNIGRGLQKLQSLKTLSLSNNNFNRIPPSLFAIPSLQFLDLSQNTISGPLFDNMFENCSSLRFLSLAGNQLQGPIPASISKCTTLNHLNLSSNRFSVSSGALWSLTSLRTLDLSKNEFSGPIPVGISKVHNLKEVFFNGNQFSASLPADIGFCPHLIAIDFSNNHFSGDVPGSLQRLKELKFLSFSNNFLFGDFPQWINQLNSLQHLDFSGNSFTGPLPPSIGGLKSLKFLSLSNNKMSGTIPDSLGDSSSLSIIRLSGNGFSGSIPESLFDMKLEEVDLSRNRLTGFIPSASSKIFENLEKMDLSGNNLKGDIPAEMGLFSKMRYLNLSWNQLETRMPPELGYFENLTVVDLRYSGLIGSIPGDLCDSGSLSILQLDGNALTGAIPDEIGNCSSLYLLSLSHNNLSGWIPESISYLTNLKILKLEMNKLSGEIPQHLATLSNLVIANISHNRLVGRLPSHGIFQTLDASAIEGNLGICSPLLSGPCTLNVPKPLVLDPFAYAAGTPQFDRTPSALRRHTFLSISSIIAISAAVVIAVGVAAIALLNASVRRRVAFVDNALESISMCSTSNRSSSLAAGKLVLFEPKPSSQDWFSRNMDSILNKTAEVGAGAFGTVYKARLGGQETMAIKKLETTNTLQYLEEFDREVRILGKVRHRNLMSLKGYYWTPQLQILVTEFAAGGSLHTRLHESCGPLTWPARFKILMETAKGLAHLHHSFQPPVIHYNIKPSNVLLDENSNVKISDFGLARLVTKHVVGNRFESGYVAPELACRSLRVNEKCDVYRFGVLMLEVVTGRRAIEYGEENVVILVDHVRGLLEEGNVLDCIDSRMGRQAEEEVLPVVKLAVVCASQIPSSRPSMAEVVQILQVIKTPLPNKI